ncbi:TrbI/VirB10 family protein [Dyella sp. M7H15-1]|uniref:type IV secretion system protein VirB10 n=1 Tax=Dyella sp. M7H15-1 TaxID=2501295 RepID=UPI0010051FA3|nr:type IV secretion system protein VirB10 [Dyella sp. M7H15-1]QAU23386.1 TrbI/VirB10 family protein [Dyella sp. M7H15-1]
MSPIHPDNQPPEGGVVESARGIPQLGARKGGGKWFMILVTGCVFVIAIGLGAHALMAKLGSTARGKQNTEKQQLSPSLPDMTRAAFERLDKPPPAPPGAQPQASQPAAPVQLTPAQLKPAQLTPAQRTAQQLALERMQSPVLAVKGASGGQPDENTPGAALGVRGAAALGGGLGAGQESTPHSSLGDALSTTRMGEVSASRLANPDLMITQGQFLDCTLITAINSDEPGMTSCVLAHNIYSTDGQVLLLERGSLLTGQYQSAQLTAGKKRIFVMWTRARMPNGVVVNLDSPSTDSVGRSGVDGKISYHFWQRFGAALLVSLVDDLSQYEQAKQAQNNGNGGTSLSLGNTTQTGNTAAGIIVQNTVNIPPTLDKAQGSHIGVFVARDIDFSNVYALHSTN